MREMNPLIYQWPSFSQLAFVIGKLSKVSAKKNIHVVESFKLFVVIFVIGRKRLFFSSSASQFSFDDVASSRRKSSQQQEPKQDFQKGQILMQNKACNKKTEPSKLRAPAYARSRAEKPKRSRNFKLNQHLFHFKLVQLFLYHNLDQRRVVCKLSLAHRSIDVRQEGLGSSVLLTKMMIYIFPLTFACAGASRSQAQQESSRSKQPSRKVYQRYWKGGNLLEMQIGQHSSQARA